MAARPLRSSASGVKGPRLAGALSLPNTLSQGTWQGGHDWEGGRGGGAVGVVTCMYQQFCRRGPGREDTGGEKRKQGMMSTVCTQ
jgi:hypothetical protein